MKNKIKKRNTPLFFATLLLVGLVTLTFFDQKKINSAGEIIVQADSTGGVLEYL